MRLSSELWWYPLGDLDVGSHFFFNNPSGDGLDPILWRKENSHNIVRSECGLVLQATKGSWVYYAPYEKFSEIIQ